MEAALALGAIERATLATQLAVAGAALEELGARAAAERAELGAKRAEVARLGALAAELEVSVSGAKAELATTQVAAEMAAEQAAARLAKAEVELAALKKQLRTAEAEGRRLLALSQGSQAELDASVAREQLGRKKITILNAQYQRLIATQVFVHAAEAAIAPPSPPRSAEARACTGVGA